MISREVKMKKEHSRLKTAFRCIVPGCQQKDDCSWNRKRLCALRYYYLLEILERKQRNAEIEKVLGKEWKM